MNQTRLALPQGTLHTPTSIMHQFILDVENDNLRNELADDCVLSLFGRHVPGANNVFHYLRTQMMNRFLHGGFQEVKSCDLAQEILIRTRFSRSFDKLRRHIHKHSNKDVFSTLHLRAESDDEAIEEECTQQLVTPPRPASQDLDMLHYIESTGVLDIIHDGDDGGIELGDSRHVLLTLGYRAIRLPYRLELNIEICLIVYEKFNDAPLKSTLVVPPRSTIAQRRRRRLTYTACTDDESDDSTEAAHSRAVRRSLFSGCDSGASTSANGQINGADEAADTSHAQPALYNIPANDEEPMIMPVYTSRKRQNTETPSASGSKRSAASSRYGMRF